MTIVEKSRLSIKISIVGVILSVLFLISNLITKYPLPVPIGLVVGNGLVLLGNYIRYRRVLGGKKAIE